MDYVQPLHKFHIDLITSFE